MNREFIEELKQKPLSGAELYRLVGGEAKIITYPDLVKYDNIDDLLEPHGAVILLYETMKNFGHWVSIFKHGDTIEHFDSYGLKPDDELKFTPEHFRKENDMDIPHLTYLLYTAPKHYKINYGHGKLQKKFRDVNTCGRWAGIRLLLRHLPTDKFIKMFKDVVKANPEYDTDDVVSLLTHYI